MKLNIERATMEKTPDSGFVGTVIFTVEGHSHPYEMTLHSKNTRDWSHSLLFAGESGPEEQILAVEDWLEEDDEAYDRLVNAAKAKL